MRYPSCLEIDLAALDANIDAWRAKLAASGSALCGVIKADAYGFGAAMMAQRLVARGARFLAVYSHAEAAELLSLKLSVPTLVMMPCAPIDPAGPLGQAVGGGRLHLTAHDPGAVDACDALGRALGQPVPLHLFVDTGMSRGGMTAREVRQVLAGLAERRGVRLAGIYSHFASVGSDDAFTEEQAAALESVLTANEGLIPRNTLTHMANTAGVLHGPRHHRHMARVGIGLYGYGAAAGQAGLRGVLRWRSQIVSLQQAPAGARVGYNGTVTLTRLSHLALVPTGYADGYPLTLSNRGSCVMIPAPTEAAGDRNDADAQRAAPVVGLVNMDQIIIDVTDVPWAAPGIDVTVIDPCDDSPCSLPALARLAGSSAYEMLCRLAPRLPRVYA